MNKNKIEELQKVSGGEKGSDEAIYIMIGEMIRAGQADAAQMMFRKALPELTAEHAETLRGLFYYKFGYPID